MADEEAITEVLDMLGPNAITEGWTTERIGEELDEGTSPNTIARRYWEFRMTRSSNLADVSESGSSRRLSQLFTNAQSLAAYYRGAETADDPQNQPSATVSREIRRV